MPGNEPTATAGPIKRFFRGEMTPLPFVGEGKLCQETY